MSFKVLIKTAPLWEKAVKAEQNSIKKATEVALNKTAYDMHKIARSDLKAGKLGLKPTEIYRNDAGDSRFKKRRKKSPLASLARGITYKVNKVNLTGLFGFLGLTSGTAWQAKIAEKSIDGYTFIYTPRAIETLHTMGIHLKKSTTQAIVTDRDPIEEINKKYSRMALLRFKDYFDRKRAGERI